LVKCIYYLEYSLIHVSLLFVVENNSLPIEMVVYNFKKAEYE